MVPKSVLTIVDLLVGCLSSLPQLEVGLSSRSKDQMVVKAFGFEAEFLENVMDPSIPLSLSLLSRKRPKISNDDKVLTQGWRLRYTFELMFHPLLIQMLVLPISCIGVSSR